MLNYRNLVKTNGNDIALFYNSRTKIYSLVRTNDHDDSEDILCTGTLKKCETEMDSIYMFDAIDY
jgi:hypothetical protein